MNWASRTCRAWRGRRRFPSRRQRRTIWASRRLMRGSSGGMCAACASNTTTASWRAMIDANARTGSSRKTTNTRSKHLSDLFFSHIKPFFAVSSRPM
ncbi:unnamed protein product, partial [Pelagomonas calceolata]